MVLMKKRTKSRHNVKTSCQQKGLKCKLGNILNAGKNANGTRITNYFLS